MPKIAASGILHDNRPEVIIAMRAQVLKGLKAIGHEAEGYAKEECPVDTSRLKNSITNKVVEAEYAMYVGTNVEYAPYVEFDTKKNHKVGKAHFLRDSVTTHNERYKNIMEAALKS